ncbi:MAG: hypothetical protein WDA22_07475 [Bacteroidota bacterium]
MTVSIQYNIQKEKNLIISLWHHNVTFDQWMNNVKKLIVEPDFKQAVKQIVDIHIGSADISIGQEEIKQVVDFIAQHPEVILGRKIAIVAGKEFNRSSFFTQLARSQFLNAIVFNDLQTACKWLGVDRQEAEVSIERIRKELQQETQ